MNSVSTELEAAETLLQELTYGADPATSHVMQAWKVLCRIDDSQPVSREDILSSDALSVALGRASPTLKNDFSKAVEQLFQFEAASGRLTDQERFSGGQIIRRNLVVIRKLRRLDPALDPSAETRTSINSRAILVKSAAMGVLVYIVCSVSLGRFNPRFWFAREFQNFTVLEASQGFGKLSFNANLNDNPLSIAGEQFNQGLGTHAPSTIVIELPSSATKFRGACGVDDAAMREGSVICSIELDGRELFNSGELRGGEAARPFEIQVTPHAVLTLKVDPTSDGRDHDHADWVELEAAS